MEVRWPSEAYTTLELDISLHNAIFPVAYRAPAHAWRLACCPGAGGLPLERYRVFQVA